MKLLSAIIGIAIGMIAMTLTDTIYKRHQPTFKFKAIDWPEEISQVTNKKDSCDNLYGFQRNDTLFIQFANK